MSIEFEARAESKKQWPSEGRRIGGKLVERRLGFVTGYIAGASRPITHALNKVTRVTVVSKDGVAFEKYDLFDSGAELHLQDDGRTLKIFPQS